MRRAARQLPQIVADGADIRPSPAANRHTNAVIGRFLVQFDGFHMHDAHGGFDILAIAGAAAGFACIWAVTPVRREPQKKPN